MNNMQIFKNPIFGEVRVIVENGKTLFCGSDVAKALGYERTQNALYRHCRHSLKRGVGVNTGTKADGTPVFQQMEMIFIPEGDVYRLAARSKLEGADKFESWIFDDVVPTVMHTGKYSASLSEGTAPRVAPPAVPLGALVRLMEFQERIMRDRGCTAFEISAMAKGTMEAYGVPVTKAFASKVDKQMCLFDDPMPWNALPPAALPDCKGKQELPA